MWLCFGLVERVTPNIVLWRQLSALKTTLSQLEIWWLQHLTEIFLVGLFLAWQPLVEYVHWSQICQTRIHPTFSMHACTHVGICKFVMELMIRPRRAKGLDNSWEQQLYVEMVACISIFGPPYRNMCLLPLEIQAIIHLPLCIQSLIIYGSLCMLLIIHSILNIAAKATFQSKWHFHTPTYPQDNCHTYSTGTETLLSFNGMYWQQRDSCRKCTIIIAVLVSSLCLQLPSPLFLGHLKVPCSIRGLEDIAPYLD